MSDSTNYGWVRLHRKFLKSDMWLSEPFTKGQAWIDLFANANHKQGTFWVRGTPIPVGRGQIAWSKLTMSDRWGWSEGKVDRFIEYLKTEGQIEVQTSSKTTLITILNYELYQADSGANSERTASRQGTNKNDKNEKNISETVFNGIHEAPDEEEPPKRRDGNKYTKTYNDLCTWLEGITGVRMVDRRGQFNALKIAREAGISTARLKERAQEQKDSGRFEEQGMDWFTVVYSFNKKA